MGCAASTSTTVTRDPGRVPPAPIGYNVTVARPPELKMSPEKHNEKNAKKTKQRKKSSSSSSSSSDSDGESLEAQRKKIKQASVAAAIQDTTPEKKTVITKQTLDKYTELYATIYNLERKYISQRLQEKLKIVILIKKEGVTLNAEYAKLQEKTAKEYQDVKNLMNLQEDGSIATYFESQVMFDTQMSKEQEEYIQAKTEMEDCAEKLKVLSAKETKLQNQIAELQKENTKLLECYQQQDEILEQMFGDSYGSEKEDFLEGQLDSLLEKKQYIESAMQRWKNALVIAQNAHSQLNTAYDRWVQIMNIPFINSCHHVRMKAGAEVRSYLVAASQNLSNIITILHPAKVPYCTHAEISTLNRAISFIFVDLMSRERIGHAAQAYITTRNRCGMLLQWVDNVIVNRISVDYERIRMESAKIRKELREERTMLMLEKVELDTGEKINLDAFKQLPMDDTDSGVESEGSDADADVLEANGSGDKNKLDQEILEASKNEVESDGQEKVEAEQEKPVSLDELAPQPTVNELFGDLDSLMAEHEQQKQDFSKAMATQEARQQLKLKEKLKRRRSRKNRLLNNQADLDKLIEEDKNQQSVENPK